MGNLDRRVARLEARSAGDPNEEREKRQWFARAHLLRNRAIPDDVRHARGLIKLFRTQDTLSEMSAEELIDRIVSWRPLPGGAVGGREVRWPAAEMEVARAIYNREPGMIDMVCPPEWRESFVAGDELYEKYVAVPDEVLAESWSFEDLDERFGITDELVGRTVGPDFERITEEERSWRIEECLADAVFGEKGYRILKATSDEMLQRIIELAG